MYQFSDKSKIEEAMATGACRQALATLLEGLVEKELPRVVAVYPGMSARKPGAVMLSVPRFILPLSGCYHFIEDPEKPGEHWAVEPGVLVWVPAGAWTLTDPWQKRSVLSLVHHPGYARLLWYDHPGDGCVVSPPRTSVGDISPLLPHSSLRLALEMMEAAVLSTKAGTRLASARALLGWAHHAWEEGLHRADRPGSSLFSGMVHFLSEAASGSISRNEVAARFGVHPDQVTRLFNQHAGVGFSAYLQRERLERARRLLKEETLSVKEISAACGFASPSYFVACFRRVYGVTPAAMRREVSC